MAGMCKYFKTLGSLTRIRMELNDTKLGLRELDSLFREEVEL